MQASEIDLLKALKQPETGAANLTGRVGTVASTSPVTATVDSVNIPCRQIAGQTLTVGQPCVLITFGIGTKPLLIQTN
ncbi:hypothetical protein [Bifidobacterium aquikefiri]|uniref:hypothetical protein n=1 Tax=Bifidobacterium aquikefiri TaxID=1653207 RepID=UPI0039ECBE59